MQTLTKERTDFYFCILVIIFILASSIAIFFNHIPWWDEAVYIGMGKFIYSFGEVGGWEIMRPIALPLVLGLFWKLGFSVLYGAKIIAVGFSVVYLFFVYLLGKRLFKPVVGLAASFFVAVTQVYFFNSLFSLTEIPSTVFALIAVYMLTKNYHPFLLGAFVALSFLFKFPQGLFFIVFLFAMFLTNLNNLKKFWKKSLLYFTGFLLVVAPFLIFNYFMYSNDVNFLVAMFRPLIFAGGEQVNPFYQGSLFYYPSELFSSNPFLVFSIVGVIFFFIKKDYKLPKTALLIALVLFIAYFSLVPNKQLRFVIMFLPYLALFAGFGFVEAYRKLGYLTMLLIVIAAPVIYYEFVGSSLFEQKDHSIVEFYSYFNKHPVKGVVLTTVPQPLVYSDIEFEPLYHIPKKTFSEIKKEVAAVAFVPSTFLCPEGDLKCREKMALFFSQVQNESIVFSREYYGNNFTVYLVS